MDITTPSSRHECQAQGKALRYCFRPWIVIGLEHWKNLLIKVNSICKRLWGEWFPRGGGFANRYSQTGLGWLRHQMNSMQCGHFHTGSLSSPMTGYIITCSCWSQSVPAASSRGRHHACRLLSRIKVSPLLILVNGTISTLPSSVPNRYQDLAIGLHSLFAVSPFRPSQPFMGVQGTFRVWEDIFLTLLLSSPDASYLQLSDWLLENTNV